MPEEPANFFLPPDSPSVKRHKRGDIREDGKVFWGYDPKCRHGESWVTSEELATRRRCRRERQKELRRATPELNRESCKKQYWADPERHRERCKKWRKENREKFLQSKRKWLSKNQHLAKEQSRQYRQRNAEKIFEARRKWQKENKEYFARYIKDRLKSDEVFAVIHRLRTRTRCALRNNTGRPKTNLHQSIGCQPQDLKNWLEQQFLPGMSWENRSLWHIDHLVPLCLAKTTEEVYALNHYTNLRPLWAKDNRSKNKRLPDSLPEYIDARIQAIYQNARKQNV